MILVGIVGCYEYHVFEGRIILIIDITFYITFLPEILSLLCVCGREGKQTQLYLESTVELSVSAIS